VRSGSTLRRATFGTMTLVVRPDLAERLAARARADDRRPQDVLDQLLADALERVELDEAIDRSAAQIERGQWVDGREHLARLLAK
jgi:predicted transcriptional regulator